ncbi:hypothetical protein BDY24DRAFT_411704 [Mrakia frigida]|uniref:zinc finger MYND domain-containing protein n=1 Tax=Mrakia frigida TaxID=29902 RepID=UPI003FCC1684
MTLPTPQEYGRYLGLSTGIDGPASSLITHPTDELFEGAVATSQNIGNKLSGEHILLFAEEFISQFFPSFVRTFTGLSSEGPASLAAHLPTESALPSLPSSSNTRIRHLLALLEEDSRFKPYTTPMNLYILKRVVGDLSLKAVRQLITERGAKQIWWSCEIERKPTDLVCTKPAEGEEMMACSRCLAVRYCSKEHQRIDWKRHKLVCFKPTWTRNYGSNNRAWKRGRDEQQPRRRKDIDSSVVKPSTELGFTMTLRLLKPSIPRKCIHEKAGKRVGLLETIEEEQQIERLSLLGKRLKGKN